MAKRVFTKEYKEKIEEAIKIFEKINPFDVTTEKNKTIVTDSLYLCGVRKKIVL
ncbi:hypothetical protein [Desulfitibacter alkalitolerans]|uniref:hypothetical protein n=1 Tax=Desulfitibacter alkalitolerans TaxID=264641 RepID=UPI0012EBD5F3|nr:hypothetical protein [Desulfitibacter alkalitolerans]